MIWSDSDGLYLAQVKELPGCLADGATLEEALQNIQLVMQEWLETAKEENRPVPEPLTFERMEKNAAAAHQAIERQLEIRVKQLVFQTLDEMAKQQATQNIPSWREGALPSFDLEKSH